MKKFFANLIIIYLFLQSCVFSVQASDNINISFNGNNIEFESPPQIIDGHTLVPMRKIFETLGYEVVWDPTGQLVGALNYDKDKIIIMRINAKAMIITPVSTFTQESKNLNELENNKKISLDVAPMLINDIAFVPIRSISESSDCIVKWDNNTRSIMIYDDESLAIDDVSNDIEQIKSYIAQGLYIEANKLCEELKSTKYLSDDDLSLINNLSSVATKKYNEYLENQGITSEEALQICKDACENAHLKIYNIVLIEETPKLDFDENEPRTFWKIEFTGELPGDYKKLYTMYIEKKTGNIYGGL